jgi:hypothetical protein
MRLVKRADIDWTSYEPVQIEDSPVVEFIRPALYRAVNIENTREVVRRWVESDPFLRAVRDARKPEWAQQTPKGLKK